VVIAIPSLYFGVKDSAIVPARWLAMFLAGDLCLAGTDVMGYYCLLPGLSLTTSLLCGRTANSWACWHL
jgi:hypothetical protein